MTTIASTKFSIGQIVHHRLFDYRGVIIDVDPVFSGTDEWYENVAKSRPPKDIPWYHILVDEGDINTYVSEQNIEVDESIGDVDHPWVENYFQAFEGGVYKKSLDS